MVLIGLYQTFRGSTKQMRLLAILSLLMLLPVLVGCEVLQRVKPEKPVSAEPGPVTVSMAVKPRLTERCPVTKPIVCAAPEVKIVERVVERSHEKIVEVPVAEGKLVLGVEELFAVVPSGLQLRSLIDSAAATTSLNVQQLTPFERDGNDWVRFQLSDLEVDKAVEIELPVKHYARVSRPGIEPQRRPFVEMSLTVGDVTHMVEVNLIERDDPQFPLLVGRNFLKDAAVVDVSLRQVQGQPRTPSENE